MKLAFNGEARYVDYSDGYTLYLNRSRKGECMDRTMYSRVIRTYCQWMAKTILENGIVDLPARMGAVAAAILTRKPQWRGKKFIGYGKMDWQKGHYDGNLKAFGLVYLPTRKGNENLRCYGFVANRRLFKKMKEKYESGDCLWTPIEFEEEMI